MSLRIKRKGKSHQFLRNDLNINQLIQMAGGEPAEIFFPAANDTSWPHLGKFAAFAKTLGDESFSYYECSREYGYISHDGRSGHGKEEFARAHLGKQLSVRACITDFWDTLSPHCEPPTALWPVPGGKISMLWRPKVFAHLLVPFLEQFESDRFLRAQSLLSALSFPIPLRFTLVDSGGPDSDHEGTPKKELVLFADGRPRGLICNRTTALELNVSPTGHCRRTSFDFAPTLGFWGPKLTGVETFESPESTLSNGILIEEARFREDLKAIEVKHSRLVHNGQVGEGVEPFILNLGLLDFLKSLHAFSQHVESIGVAFSKGGYKLIADCKIPWAISPEVPSPGQPGVVYW